MNRDPVSSETIATVGYDLDSATLEIEFTNGSVYQYFDVPEGVYGELLGADSLGRYFNTVIRGSYRYAQT